MRPALTSAIALFVALSALGSSASSTTWSFGDMPAGSLSPAAFATAGEWRVADGAATVGADGQASIRPLGAPWVSDGSATVLARATADSGVGGWRSITVALDAGAGDSWGMLVVVGPDGTHYGDLIEGLGGVWQAQGEGPTRLARTADDRNEPWSLGTWYRIGLTLHNGEVRGEVAEADGGRVLFSRGYVLAPDVPAARAGRAKVSTTGLAVEVRSITVDATASGAGKALSRTVGVLAEEMPGATPGAVDGVVEGLSERFDVRRVSAAEASQLAPSDVGVLVLPDCARLPGRLAGALRAYMEAGGRVLAIGGPLFDVRYVPGPNGWASVADALAETKATHEVASLADGFRDWQRSAGPQPCEATWEPTAAPDGSRGASVRVTGLKGWDTYYRRDLEAVFPAGHTLTCLWAKGSPTTPQLVVEWDEADGSRWIARVGLTAEWKRYALLPDDFRYWPDSPAKGRGGSGDHLHIENARTPSIGIAQGPGWAGDGIGNHEWAVAGVGTAPSPVQAEDLAPLDLTCLSPWYARYAIEGPRPLRLSEAARAFGLERAPSESWGSAICPISRPRGLGWASTTPPGRFIPLVEAETAGVPRSPVAFVWQPLDGPLFLSRWGGLGLSYRPELADTVRALVRALLEPAVLARAGTDRAGFFVGEGAGHLGALVANRDHAPVDVTVTFRIRREDGSQVSAAGPVSVTVPGGAEAFADGGALPDLAPGFYKVATVLRAGEGERDTIVQPFSVQDPARERGLPRVSLSRDGTGFEANGKPFHPHGCNYWPSYVSGLDPTVYNAHWLSPWQYDPELVERDLALLERLGGNLVSVAIAQEEQIPPLIDLLARCARHEIRVNLCLPTTHPLSYDLARTRKLLTAARLALDGTVFSYDLAWEPNLGSYEARRALDARWATWLEDQFGGIDAAESALGCTLPRDQAGKVTGPSDEQLVSDGDHRVIVCAYRRFVDDIISWGYGEVRSLIRDDVGDPALLGARTGYGGTGQPWAQRQLPFDLLSGAAHLDFTSPEGYGLDGEYQAFRLGGFTTEYGRWAGNGKPVFWAEFGRSVHQAAATEAEALELQRRLYENLYRMVVESGADGSACWWWPGGYRVNEDSDYGIIAPDGTPRPAALELARFAAEITGPRPLGKPDGWITIDRDASARGYTAVWEAGRDHYADEVARGHRLAVRTEATGTTTATVPRVGLGNTVWRPGLPWKWLSGEIHDARGEPGTQRVAFSLAAIGELSVPADGTLALSVEVVNTSEVTWLPASVSVTGYVDGQEVFSTPVAGQVGRYGRERVPIAGTHIPAQGRLVVRLTCEGHPFGTPLKLGLRAGA